MHPFSNLLAPLAPQFESSGHIAAFAGNSSRENNSLWARLTPVSSVLRVEGRDAIDFLQGMVTNEVKKVPPGSFNESAFLNNKGKLLFLANFVRGESCHWLIQGEGDGESLKSHLEKYTIIQEVNITPEPQPQYSLEVGGSWDELPPPGVGSYQSPSEGGWILSGTTLGGGATVLGRVDFLIPYIERLMRRSHPTYWLGEREWNYSRIKQGIPRVGGELGDLFFLEEVGMGRIVNATKGCFLGQEVMARIRNFGHVNRRMVIGTLGGLIYRAAGNYPALPWKLGGGGEAGWVTSFEFSPTGSETLALAVVKKTLLTGSGPGEFPVEGVAGVVFKTADET